jgi:hypothetical protein
VPITSHDEQVRIVQGEYTSPGWSPKLHVPPHARKRVRRRADHPVVGAAIARFNVDRRAAAPQHMPVPITSA